VGIKDFVYMQNSGLPLRSFLEVLRTRVGGIEWRTANQENARIPHVLAPPSQASIAARSARRWKKRRTLIAGAAILAAKARRTRRLRI